MKDPQGHGSNSRGSLSGRINRFVTNSDVSPEDRNAWMGDRAAAAKLREGSGPKSDVVPPHPAMTRSWLDHIRNGQKAAAPSPKGSSNGRGWWAAASGNGKHSD